MHFYALKVFPVSLPESPDNYANSVVHFLSIFYVFITITLLIRLLSQTLITPIEVQALNNPAPEVVAPEQTSSPSPVAAPSATPEQDTTPHLVDQTATIKQYIRTIFGKDAPTAYAIALAESGKSY